MTRGSEARLFVALDLPGEVRAQLAWWGRAAAASVCSTAPSAATMPPAFASRGRFPSRRREARPLPTRQLRLLESDTLHVTLAFLGNRPVGEIEALGRVLSAVCAESAPLGELSFGAPLWLPPRHPRALAVEVHDGAEHALEALHTSIRTALAAICEREPAGAFVTRRNVEGPARRRFRPHVTVARMRPAEAPRERQLPVTPAIAFQPRSITLQRSWLTSTEAVYEGLITCPLGGAF
jgi:RNA 2',3'-cyclic 3'-phosphodiesterase